MKIVVINGSGGCGKDTFVRMCQKIRPSKIYNISMIDAIKREAKSFGWHDEKDDKARRFLSDLKDAWERYNDGPYDLIKYRIELIEKTELMRYHTTDDIIIFIHAREPDDIERLVKDFDAFTLLIRRPSTDRAHGNHADDCVEEWGYDMIYENIGDFEDMEFEARMILNYIDGFDTTTPKEWVNELHN